LSANDEVNSSIKNHFYVLVNLQSIGEMPEYYIIPQQKLARQLYDDHREYLAGGKNRKDTTMRLFDPYKREKSKLFGEKYKDNWDILGLL